MNNNHKISPLTMNVTFIFLLMLLILLRYDAIVFIIQDLAYVQGICGINKNALYGSMWLKLFMMKLKMN